MSSSHSDLHLNNPPIIEAVIDIRCSLDPQIKVTDLELLHDKIKSDYPTKEGRKAFTAQFKIAGGKPTEFSQKDLGIHGYLFKSSDQKQIVQYRLDGFTFSRLKPYENWEKMRDEAKRLWDIYQTSVHPRVVQRLAVRYINSINLPPSPFELSDFFETYPKLSDKLADGSERFITNFTSVIELKLPDDISATIRQRTRPEQPGTIVLDIDLYSLSQHEPGSSIWEILDTKFWPLKDELFSGSFTEKGYNFLKKQ